MSNYTPILDRPMNSGTQQVYKFPNGYGASVIRGPYTYGGEHGLFEVGVLQFSGDDYKLTYDTPITDDVIGHLTPDKVTALLDRIAALPADATAGA